MGLVSTKTMQIEQFLTKFYKSGIGQEALVTEQIDNLRETGAIRINGVLWTAKSADDTQIPIGMRVVIERIEGAKVYVKPAGVPAEA